MHTLGKPELSENRTIRPVPRPSGLQRYVDRTWLKSSVWGPENWSVFGRSVRTNNDCEGWHLKLNQHAKKANLPFYLLLTLLCEEASLLPTQATTKEEHVSPGKNLQAVGSVRERRIVSQRPTEEMQWHLWTKCMNSNLCGGWHVLRSKLQYLVIAVVGR
ncbi:hypothetical protein DPMN_123027 [Dreissena polymorpha]|uniref:Uncharacterized protein n=1 Tax=Dreissena polymorpha TaxID=45954 RepID=A0A9D4GTM5_DREPO|nr:hypothetical protein DPMN_123027 [Dreissena polymorpha]